MSIQEEDERIGSCREYQSLSDLDFMRRMK
jgi:hypothetical protein